MGRDTGWFKSSHSNSGSDTCLEVRMLDTGWFKSSHSNSGSDTCLEVRMLDTGWFKSSHSNSGSDDCVEVRMVANGPMIGLRDSKNPAGGAFWVSSDAWSRFVTSTSSDEFDRL